MKSYSIFDQGRISDEVEDINDLLLGFGAVYPNKENNAPYSSYNKFMNKRSSLGAVLNKNIGTNSYTLSLEVPRFTKEQITVELKNNMIKVSGDRLDKPIEGENNFDYSSRKFNFNYTFPEKVAADKITAELKDGVLIITAYIVGEPYLQIPIK